MRRQDPWSIRFVAVVSTLLASAPAHAISSHRSGPWIGADVGLSVGATPAARFGWRATVGGWAGNVSDDSAFGRYWAFGAAVRQDLHPNTRVRTAFTGVARRGIDILVLGVSGFAEAGAELEGGRVGVTARVGGDVCWRRNSYVGPTLRLDAGATWIDRKLSPRFGVALGGQLKIPGRKLVRE